MADIIMDIIAFFDNHSGFSTFISSLIVAIITGVYTYLSWHLLRESKKMRMLQNQPRVSITFEPEGHKKNVIDLIVKNTGLGPALDLRFSLDSDIQIVEEMYLSEVGLIKKGIPYLAPNQEIRFLYTILYGESEEKFAKPVVLRASYRDVFNKEYNETFTLDLTILFGMLGLSTPPLEDLVDTMKEIRKDTCSIASEIKSARK